MAADKRVKCFCAVGLALLLCSCATQAQRQFQAIKASNQTNAAQLMACSTEVYNSSDYDLLRAHIPLSIYDATLEQLSDSNLASPAEIKALFTVHPRLQECRKAFLTATSQTEPGLVPIVTTLLTKNEDDLVTLTQRKISWGEYVHRIRDRMTETQTALQAEDRRVVAGLQQEHQAEVAHRQRAAEALAAWAQTQQAINAANRPVVTNCNTFGNSVNCVSR